MPAPEKNLWTVIFLIKAVDTTINEVIVMIDHLMKIEFRNELSVLLCINFDRNNLDALLKRDSNLVSTDPDKVFTTMFFKVTRNDGDTVNSLSKLDEKRDFDITEEDDLSSFFQKQVLQNFQAKRYLLFTWDHGNGFEIFSGEGQGSLETRTASVINGNTPALTMDELSQAIKWSLGEQKIDLIIMMNCSMQVFDTGYALRDAVGYLVAPQNLLGFLHYDYKALFSTLSDNPEISSDKLATFVIDSFALKVEREGTRLNVSLSACELLFYDRMANLLDKLAEELQLRLDNDINSIRDAFKTAKTVHEGLKLIDLYALLSNLDKAPTEKEHVHIKDLFDLKDQCILKKYVGPDFISTTGDVFQTHNGISILTPFRNTPQIDFFALEVVTMDIPSESSFQKTVWGKFMTTIKELEAIGTQ